MCVIDWCAFSWQAFATLATGFAAVGGATFIGLRQHGLVREQADIARQQAKTAETAAHVATLKLRADLFDKRMNVYLAVQTYLKSALSGNHDAIWKATPELGEQLTRAQFLFSTETTSKLQVAIQESDDLHDAKVERAETKEAGGDITAMTSDIRVRRKRQRENLQQLADVLGDEMKLFDDRKPAGIPTKNR